MADNSSGTGVKPGIIVFLIFMGGWTYWNRSSDLSEAKTACLSQLSAVNDINNPDALCDCTMNEMSRRVSIIHYVPVVKNFIREPDGETIFSQAVRLCVGG